LLIALAQRVHEGDEAGVHRLLSLPQAEACASLRCLHSVLRLKQLREARHVGRGPGWLALRGGGARLSELREPQPNAAPLERDGFTPAAGAATRSDALAR